MPSRTKFNPATTSDFDKNKLLFDAQGVSTTITPNTTSNVDLTLTDDCLITGAWLIISNSQNTDYLCFQIVDTTGVTGLPPGTVLNQFITNWYLDSSVNTQFDMLYPAKILSGLTLRVVYTSTSSTISPLISINYKLHKVLV